MRDAAWLKRQIGRPNCRELGGCPIAPTNADGVVDEFGRVFDGSKPQGATDTLPGLYVVDGSAIPGALVANPTLTIAAQAIKTLTQALP